MKRIVSIIGTVLVVGSVACSSAGAATAPSIDHGGVRDAASEEAVTDQLLDDEMAAPRIASSLPVDTSDDDELYATRGRDFGAVFTRDVTDWENEY